MRISDVRMGRKFQDLKFAFFGVLAVVEYGNYDDLCSINFKEYRRLRRDNTTPDIFALEK